MRNSNLMSMLGATSILGLGLGSFGSSLGGGHYLPRRVPSKSVKHAEMHLQHRAYLRNKAKFQKRYNAVQSAGQHPLHVHPRHKRLEGLPLLQAIKAWEVRAAAGMN